MTKSLKSDTLSKSESKNGIVFASPDIFCSIQYSYLQSKHNRLEFKTPASSINCNQKYLLKTWPNAQQNDKKPTQLLSQKKNHDCICQFSPTHKENSIYQLNPEP